MKRNDEIVSLRRTGLPLRTIAGRFGLSHERVRQIVMGVFAGEIFRAYAAGDKISDICRTFHVDEPEFRRALDTHIRKELEIHPDVMESWIDNIIHVE